MTRNSLFLQVAFLLILLGGMKPSYAQLTAADSSFAGRTIHVYLPADDIDSLVLRNWSIIGKKRGKYWHSFTFPNTVDKYQSNAGFFFTNYPRNNLFLVKPGLGNAEGPQANRWMPDDFKGKNEMWIIVDPSGPISAKPVILAEPPKIVNILNPWETTGPRLVLPYGKKNMVTSADRCGWFMAFLLDARDTKLHFEELNGTATYGTTGLATPVADYDIAGEFTTKAVPDTFGTNLWLDTDINAWLPTYPNKDGNCQYQMAVTVRDFSAAHPDFDFGNVTGDHSVAGIAQQNIGPDPGRKPVLNTANISRDPAISFSRFNEWWVTDSTRPAPYQNYESCHDIPMSKTGDGGWEYDSFRDSPDHGFWPVEGALNRFNETVSSCYVKPPPDSTNWVTNGPKRNGNFCMESHASFIYQPGQTFSFRGDDDVWVFINGRLVVDLGGVHVPKSANVNLDTMRLTAGQTYKWDLFYCDRQACGSSLRIKTSIYFRQQKALDTVRLAGTGGSQSFEIIKREGGKGSCAGLGDSMKVVAATNLTYQLWDATGKVVAPLGNGSFYGGSIVIATAPPASKASVTVDTNIVVTALTPGNYRIVAFDPANQRVRAEIPYKVPARNLVEIHAPTAPLTVPLGTVVRVILANKFNGVVDPSATKYVPSFPGVDVYLDSLKTRKATADDYTTDATGYDTVWVTDTALAYADKVHLLAVPGTLPTFRLTFSVPKVAFQPLVPTEYRLGTLVPVVAVNSELSVPGRYKLIIPDGLEVYENPDRTGRVSSTDTNTTLLTNAAGVDTLWVTGGPATADKNYILAIRGSNQVSITFLVPTERVGFDSAYVKTVPMGTVVGLLASNRENGQLMPGAKGYTLVIPPGLEVYADAGKATLLGKGPLDASLTTAIDGRDTLWVTADSLSTNYKDSTFTIRIAGTLPIAVVTFTMPQLDLALATLATMYDDNADGFADRLVVTYDRDISADAPDAASYRWPAAATAVPITDIPDKIAGSTLTATGQLTSVANTGGEGLYTSTYMARNRENTQTLPIVDKMGPTLTDARMILGSTHDTLRLKFSEPIQASQINAPPEALFGYQLVVNGEVVSFTPVVIGWSADGTQATLVFPNTVQEIPKAGNLVRINDGAGLIADVKGNTAGPRSRFVPIGGTRRPDIRTVTYKVIADGQGLMYEEPVVPSVQPITSTVEEVVKNTGRMGHLIKTDLSDFAVGGADLSQVILEYNVAYFTNHGIPVTSKHATVKCTDTKVFKQDCVQDKGNIFLGWNYTSDGKNRVGTGAYVVRMQYWVRAGGEEKEKGSLTQTWGVVR